MGADTPKRSSWRRPSSEIMRALQRDEVSVVVVLVQLQRNTMRACLTLPTIAS